MLQGYTMDLDGQKIEGERNLNKDFTWNWGRPGHTSEEKMLITLCSGWEMQF